MAPPSTKTLDHLVHLTPPGTVQQASEQFRNLGFTVIPGGTHTDGMTANALVILSDSVYLELLCFVHPVEYYPPGSDDRKKRENHFWTSKIPGWIDFAFLGNGSLVPGERISDAINGRAKTQLYAPEAPGGRQRPDGEVLKWVLSMAPDEWRGTLPFFCGDVTPRERRVSPNPAHAEHPSTVTGIAYVRIITSAENFETIKRDLTFVIGDEPTSSSTHEASWKLDTGRPRGEKPTLILNTPSDASQTEFFTQSGTGIYEVAFHVKNGKNGTGETPYGKVRWIPEN